MANTIRRISVGVTKENLRQLDTMCEEFGESKSQVVKRALTILFYISKNQGSDKNQDNKELLKNAIT